MIEFLSNNYQWLITTLVLVGGLIVSILSLRKSPPKQILSIVNRKNSDDVGVGLFILGGILGLIIGSNLPKKRDVK